MPPTNDKLEVYRSDHDGDWHWHRQAANGEIIAQGEGYTRREDARTGALRANHDIPEDQLVEVPSDYNTEVDG